MMKSRLTLCCVCTIAMLLLSNAAFGVIVTSDYDDEDASGDGYGEGGPTVSVAFASATPSTPESWGAGEGTRSVSTTVAGTFNFGGSIYGHVYAAMTSNIFGGYAYAFASGHVSFPSNYRSLEFSISAYDSAGQPDDFVYNYRSYSSSTYFAANTGISSSNVAAAEASVSSSGWDEASAYARAEASPSMN